MAGVGRVGVWRGGVRSHPSPSHRTGRARIRLSDKTSRLRPRHVAPKPTQTYEPEVPVEVREWIAPALAPPDFVLGAQPPAQPHGCVGVERPIRFADGSHLE